MGEDSGAWDGVMTTGELAAALLALPGLSPADRDRECRRLANDAKGALAQCRADAAREAYAAGTSYTEHARQAGVSKPIISRLLADFPSLDASLTQLKISGRTPVSSRSDP